MENTIVSKISELYSNPMETYVATSNLDGGADGWKQTDPMTFIRRMKLEQEIRFLEFWLPRMQKNLSEAQRWATIWKTQNGGDEIGETKFQAAKAKVKGELFTVNFMQSELDATQLAYLEEYEKPFTSIPLNTNVGDVGDGTPTYRELTKEEEEECEALGI